jgi:hypothetical protein
MPEEPIRAIIASRFDLGYIVKHPNGRLGQLRVPEMSRSTAECDRSADTGAGIGNTVEVYVVRETDDGYLFSEFSAEERSRRQQKREDWLRAQEQAEVGQALLVRVERKLQWGCICRQEAEPFLEGVILAPETAAKNRLPSQCAPVASDWERLMQGSSVAVEIVHKQWQHWRYVLYFSLSSPRPTAKDG